MKKITSLLYVNVLFSFLAFSQVDSISNINIVQRTDGSKILDIYYDLHGSEYYYNIELQVSFDQGNTFSKIDSLEGDWDVGVSPELNRHVIWEAGKEYPDEYYDNVYIRIISSTEYFTCGVSELYHKGLLYGTRSHKGRCWLDRNLGSPYVASWPYLDSVTFGHAYQWGRLMDGHQILLSETTTDLSASDIPGHDKFIVTNDLPNDWRSPQNDNLWQGVAGINNPCPSNFKIPTKSEWDNALTDVGSMISSLKLPYSGTRLTNGYYYFEDDVFFADASYWSSTVDGDQVYVGNWYYTGQGTYLVKRGLGLSVRCIYDNSTDIEKPGNVSPSNGSIDVSEFVDLEWAHDEPSMQFDVFFGIDPNPPLVAHNNSNTSYDPGILEFNTTYYWKIVAIYPGSIAITSDLWSFTTRGFTCGSSIIEFEDITYNTIVYQDRCWLDRNLGASQAATSSNDPLSFGNYYQWGRLADGHEAGTSVTTSILSNCNVPGHDMFIVPSITPFDWRSPQNDSLWQGENGINNPCPEGWHVPSLTEWVIASSLWNNRNDAFDSLLQLPSSGYRQGNTGNVIGTSETGLYWSKSILGQNSNHLYFDISTINTQASNRSNGYPIRCIKNETVIAPQNPFPANDTTMFTKHLNLWWHCINPNGDSLFFDIYFGLDTTPPLIATEHTDTIYSPGVLEYNKTYYWKIVAKNKFGLILESDLWSFTVEAFICGTTTLEDNGLVYGTVEYLDQCWFDRNLGATRVPLALDDTLGYGGYYQWRRITDGHEYPYSTLTYTRTPLNFPGHSQFIRVNSDDPGDWQDPQKNLPERIGNPCPTGWIVPSIFDHFPEMFFDTLSNSFNTPLKIPMSGYRYKNDGSISYRGSFGQWWLTEITWGGDVDQYYFPWYLSFYPNSVSVHYDFTPSHCAAHGRAIRCVQDIDGPQSPSNPSPADGSSNQTVNLALSWDGHGASLFNIYFGDEINLTKIESNHPDTFYTLNFSEYNKTFYWKVAAVDIEGYSKMSDLWSFTTEELECGASNFTYKGIDYGTALQNGSCWMDRNLGALRVAESIDDSLGFGDYYQWGRLMDGHQLANSDTTHETVDRDNPGHNYFIIKTEYPKDWRIPANINLWQGVDEINNPCPVGWKVPTDAEWDLVSQNWNNQADAFISNLKLPNCGYRESTYISGDSYYWSSSIVGYGSYALKLTDYNKYWDYMYRYHGIPVRCIYSNSSPNIPDNPYPGDWDFDVEYEGLWLSWNCSDPDNDPLFYDICFGTDPEPTPCGFVTWDTNYYIDLLDPGVTYYWQIIVFDGLETVSGPVWQFTTETND